MMDVLLAFLMNIYRDKFNSTFTVLELEYLRPQRIITARIAYCPDGPKSF